jgi:hypothetical protein
MSPQRRPSASVRRMQSRPIGPTGAAIASPIASPSSRALKATVHRSSSKRIARDRSGSVSSICGGRGPDYWQVARSNSQPSSGSEHDTGARHRLPGPGCPGRAGGRLPSRWVTGGRSCTGSAWKGTMGQRGLRRAATSQRCGSRGHSVHIAWRPPFAPERELVERPWGASVRCHAWPEWLTAADLRRGNRCTIPHDYVATSMLAKHALTNCAKDRAGNGSAHARVLVGLWRGSGTRKR